MCERETESTGLAHDHVPRRPAGPDRGADELLALARRRAVADGDEADAISELDLCSAVNSGSSEPEPAPEPAEADIPAEEADQRDEALAGSVTGKVVPAASAATAGSTPVVEAALAIPPAGYVWGATY